MRRMRTRAPLTIPPVVVLLSLLSCLVACAQGVGWRTDGTGKYPDATPVTTWSPEEHVIWSLDMDTFSNATPVFVDDRLFTLAEPDRLVCVDAVTGELLWERTNSLAELADPAEVTAIEQAQEDAAELRKQINKANGQIWRAKQDLQDKPDDETLKARIEELQEQQKALREQLRPYNEAWYSLPEVNPTNGFASATPVTDGQNVYVLFATGVCAAYDLEGNRLWSRVVGKSTIEWGPSQSPLLCGDLLIVHPHKMLGLNKLTGEEIWQAELPEKYGTPFVTTVGETEVLVTASGHFVRASDGKVLARADVNLDYCGPVVHQGVAYFIQHGGCAVKLPDAIVNDELALQELWRTEPKKERYYASPVVHEGLIYAVMQKGIISVIDAATGQVVVEKQLDFGKSVGYPSPTLAGEYLYFSDDNGNTWVMRPGKELQDVGHNKLEPFRCCPVFIGDKLFIRALKNLYCIADAAG